MKYLFVLFLFIHGALVIRLLKKVYMIEIFMMRQKELDKMWSHFISKLKKGFGRLENRQRRKQD